jgi:hypothetical protein
MGFWERYAGGLQGRAGVALVSTQGALQDALGEKVLISRIRYIDFETEPEYSSNPLHRGITKSLEYSDENECRALIHDFPYGDGVSYWDPLPDDVAVGYHVRADLATLLQRVVISPYSPDIRADVDAMLQTASGLAVMSEPSSLQRPRFF